MVAKSYARVDYFSYTFSAGIEEKGESSLLVDHYNTLKRCAPAYCKRYIDEWDFTVPKRRGGYTAGFNIRNAIYVWTNFKTLLVELTGDGCTMLYETGELMEIIRENVDGATRIDIAHDIETDAKPIAFANSTLQYKTSAKGVQVSRDGETRYIGSKKSDRFCKVYRYNPPHPRSHLLRIEYSYKKENAVIVSKEVILHGEAIVAFSSGKRYDWQHKAYKELKTPDMIEIRAHRKDRNTSKTMFWYKTQVLAALKKLVASGDITIDELIDDMRGLQCIED